MTALEQIRQMKQQGLQDDEITNRLQEQGVSPKSINDALNQSKIKDAITGDEMEQDSNQDYYEPATPQQNRYSPRAQDISQQDYGTPQNLEGEYAEMPQQQEYYPQEGYDAYSTGGGGGTDLMIEVAEQIFLEKSRKIKKEIESLNEFATLSQSKIKNQEERLKRIETMIDKLQITILEKIGSYGDNLNSIKKEMTMMQDSFGKVLPEIVKKHSHSKKK